MRQAKHALVIATFALVSCSSQVIPASTPATPTTVLRLYSATATIPLLQELTTAYSLSHPNIAFDTSFGSYDSMVDRLRRLETPFFLSNHLPIDTPFVGFPIGQDGIAVIVHPDNPVTSLSLEQIRLIFQGQITSWGDVGGNPRDIIVVSREGGSGTRAEFEMQVMGDRQTTLSAQVAPSSAAMITSIARQTDAIGYVSMGHLNDSVRTIIVEGIPLTIHTVFDNTYPLRSIIYIVGLEDPVEEAVADYRAFIAWAQSPEGQAIVARLHAPMIEIP